MHDDSGISVRFWEMDHYFLGYSEVLWFIFGKD